MDAAPTMWSIAWTRTHQGTRRRRLKRQANASCPSSVTSAVSNFQKPPNSVASAAWKGSRFETRHRSPSVVDNHIMYWRFLIFETKNAPKKKYYRKDIFWTKEYILIFLFRERSSQDRGYRCFPKRRVSNLQFREHFARSRACSENILWLWGNVFNCLIMIIYNRALYNSGDFCKS